MGGNNSGTWLRSGRKRLTCECLTIDIKDTEKLDSIPVEAQFQETACNFGGKRKWFVCPGGCGKRARTLYRWQGVWRCRKCHGLAYRSQLRSKSLNSVDKARKLRTRLGIAEPVIMSPLPPKPPLMSRRRYQKIASDIMQAEIIALREMTILGLRHDPICNKEGKPVKDSCEKATKVISGDQQKVIELLSHGLQESDVAAVTGVALNEIRIWKQNDPVFVAELNYRRKVLWENSVDQLRGLIPHALTALQDVLTDANNPQRWRAAMEVVKIVGLSPEASHDLGRVVGPDDPREVERRMR